MSEEKGIGVQDQEEGSWEGKPGERGQPETGRCVGDIISTVIVSRVFPKCLKVHI